jgi:hypothetical protein
VHVVKPREVAVSAAIGLHGGDFRNGRVEGSIERWPIGVAAEPRPPAAREARCSLRAGGPRRSGCRGHAAWEAAGAPCHALELTWASSGAPSQRQVQ